jgi:hypothetical protein
MAIAVSTFIDVVESDPQGYDVAENYLPAPSKVALSAAQGQLRSTTPGYRETDIQLLTMEAGQPMLSHGVSFTANDQDISVGGAQSEERIELYREIAASYCCFTLFPPFLQILTISGLNDGAPGALLPSLERDYSLNYAVVSLIFLSITLDLSRPPFFPIAFTFFLGDASLWFWGLSSRDFHMLSYAALIRRMWRLSPRSGLLVSASHFNSRTQTAIWFDPSTIEVTEGDETKCCKSPRLYAFMLR